GSLLRCRFIITELSCDDCIAFLQFALQNCSFPAIGYAELDSTSLRLPIGIQDPNHAPSWFRSFRLREMNRQTRMDAVTIHRGRLDHCLSSSALSTGQGIPARAPGSSSPLASATPD